MSYDSYKISQEPGKATFWTKSLKQNKIIFPYVDHLKEPHLYGTNSKAEHSMVNICLLFQKGDHYWRKDMTFLTYESFPHTCHKLWTKICEIRQNFKGDLTKFCEIFLNITLELPQYSLNSFFFFSCKKVVKTTTVCDLCLFLHKIYCKIVWKFCEIWIFMGIAFQMGQILWDFISQCEVWHVCSPKGIFSKRKEWEQIFSLGVSPLSEAGKTFRPKWSPFIFFFIQHQNIIQCLKPTIIKSFKNLR